MKALSLALLMPAAFHVSNAQHAFKVPVGDLGWAIHFEGPVLAKQQIAIYPGGYQFRANSGRFNVSVFVEPQQKAGGSHRDCLEFYWQQASRNPLIQDSSIKIAHGKKFSSASYMIAGSQQGAKFRQQNANYFFVYKDRWIDVHASVIEPTDEDSGIFQRLEESLACVEDKEAHDGMAVFNFGIRGYLMIALPAGWTTEAKSIENEDGKHLGIGLETSAGKRANERCKLTIAAVPPQPLDQKAIRDRVLEICEPFVARSVEKKKNLRDFAMAKGFGAYCVFTDASLVGKPPQPGNSKVMASGMVLPAEDVAVAASIFTDDASGNEFQAMVKAVGSIITGP